MRAAFSNVGGAILAAHVIGRGARRGGTRYLADLPRRYIMAQRSAEPVRLFLAGRGGRSGRPAIVSMLIIQMRSRPSSVILPVIIERFIKFLDHGGIFGSWSKLASRLAIVSRNPQRSNSAGAQLIARSASFRLPAPR